MKLKNLKFNAILSTVIILVSFVGWGVSGQTNQSIEDEDFRARLTEYSNDLIKSCSYIESTYTPRARV